MRQEFIKKWKSWWMLQNKGEELTDAFEMELNAIIEHEIACKNLVKTNIKHELLCDHCGCHPTVFYNTNRGMFCVKCKPSS